MGVYLKSDPMPEKKIIELSPDAFSELLHILGKIFLHHANDSWHCSNRTEQLDTAFLEFFVAYELLELALENYHYDPDEGLEMRPEFAEELDRRVADYEAGRTKPVPMAEVFKKLGIE